MTGSLAAGSVGRTNLLGNFEQLYGAELIGATVVRIRGVIYTSSANTGQLMAFAAMVEPDPVGALDVAEGPSQRPYAPWMLYEPFVTSGAAAGPQVDVSARVIDVKAARRVDELDQQLSLYYDTPSGNSAAVSFHFTLSIGVKLP